MKLLKRTLSVLVTTAVLSTSAPADAHRCLPLYEKELANYKRSLIADLYDYEEQKKFFDDPATPIVNMVVFSAGFPIILLLEGGVQISNAAHRPFLRTMVNFLGTDPEKQLKAEKQLYRYAHGFSRLRRVSEKRLAEFRPVLEMLKKKDYLLCPGNSVLSLSAKGRAMTAPYETGQEYLEAMHAQRNSRAIHDLLEDPSNFEYAFASRPLKKKDLVKLLKAQL